MDKLDLVTVYTVRDAGHAEVIRGALEAEGISCQIGGEGQGGYTGLFDIEVLVRAIDADAAKKIIESHESRK